MSGTTRVLGRAAGAARLPSQRAAQATERGLLEAILERQSVAIRNEQATRRIAAWGDTVAQFRNPWGLAIPAWLVRELPRLDGPVPGLVSQLAPSLLRQHPAMRVIQLGLLLRDLSEQVSGRPATLLAYAPGDQGGSPGGWTFPPGWDQVLVCRGGSTGPGNTSVAGDCDGEAVLPYPPESSPGYQSTAQWIAANGLSAATPATMLAVRPASDPWPSDWFAWQNAERWQWTGPDYPPGSQGAIDGTPTFEQPQPGGQPGLQSREDTQPGLFPGWRARDQLGRFMLPGARGGYWNLRKRDQALVHAVRAALALRESVQPAPTAPHPPAHPGRLDEVGSVVQVEGTSRQVHPWPQRAEPHTFQRPTRGVREKKLRLTPAFFAVGFLWNAFTESNDFVKAIWDALPRECKKARRTADGNRRTDRMLEDLYRCFGRIDWDVAAINLKYNNMEDQAFGLLSALATKAGFLLRRGGGQGGLGTDTALNPHSEGWGSGSAQMEGFNHPLSNALNALKNRELEALRWARREAQARGGR